jgi:hypothetical protein
MNETKKIQLFEDKRVRTAWDEEKQEWYFSVVDVIAVLTDSVDAAAYWRKLKERLKKEGNETVTNCHGLKMTALDGKQRLTDVADTEQLLRIIQSVPSPKAEPFKAWLAKVGSERLDETVNPELSIDRAVQNYRRLGYSESWINQRLKSIEVRKALTDEWNKSGVEPGVEYAELTDLMSKTWSGMTTGEYKKHKSLKKEALRDHMTNTELVLNMLAEVAATDISAVRNPVGFKESAEAAEDGAKAAKAARAQIEKSTGKSVVSRLNAKNLNQKKLSEGKNNTRSRIKNHEEP